MEQTQTQQKDTAGLNDVRDLIDQNLGQVEAKVDSAVDGAKAAVHELKAESQEVVDQAFDRFQAWWERTQRRLEKQVGQNPWLFIGGVLLLGYLLSRSGRRFRNQDSQSEK